MLEHLDVAQRLRRLREAHAVLSIELMAARREAAARRKEVAGLRHELDLVRRERAGLTRNAR